MDNEFEEEKMSSPPWPVSWVWYSAGLPSPALLPPHISPWFWLAVSQLSDIRDKMKPWETLQMHKEKNLTPV